MSTSTREKIIAYLGQGIQQSIVASSCGVTPAYVSQLLELEEVRTEVAELKAKQLQVALDVDSTIERVEAEALRQIEKKLPFVRSAVEAAKVYSTLNAAKRKASSAASSEDVIAAQQVTIIVPRGAALHFKINANNQVIEVEGRTMAPLPSRALPDLQRSKLATASDKSEVQDVVALEHKARATAADEKRATSVLNDLTTFMNGVAVVL